MHVCVFARCVGVLVNENLRWWNRTEHLHYSTKPLTGGSEWLLGSEHDWIRDYVREQMAYEWETLQRFMKQWKWFMHAWISLVACATGSSSGLCMQMKVCWISQPGSICPRFLIFSVVSIPPFTTPPMNHSILSYNHQMYKNISIRKPALQRYNLGSWTLISVHERLSSAHKYNPIKFQNIVCAAQNTKPIITSIIVLAKVPVLRYRVGTEILKMWQYQHFCSTGSTENPGIFSTHWEGCASIYLNKWVKQKK